MIFRALDTYLSQEASALLGRDDLPPAVDALIAAHATAPIARDTSTVATYAASREGPLQAWLREACAPLGPRVLEIGAGLGVSGRSDVIALDCAFSPLRRNPAAVRVCGDAGDPPFGPAGSSHGAPSWRAASTPSRSGPSSGGTQRRAASRRPAEPARLRRPNASAPRST